MLDAVFFVRSMSRLYKEYQFTSQSELEVERESLQAGRHLSVAVAEAGDSPGTQRNEIVRRRKLLPSSVVKTVTEDTSVCVRACMHAGACVYDGDL
jgi:hypothetical protein